MKKFLLSLLIALGCLAQAIAQPSGSGIAGYPPSSTPVFATAAATTGGIAAQIPAAINQFTYLSGISISPGSATAAITLQVTVGNIVGGPFTWFIGAPATAAGTTGAPFTLVFNPPLRGSVTNSVITFTIGALGAGGVNQTINAWGYTQ